MGKGERKSNKKLFLDSAEKSSGSFEYKKVIKVGTWKEREKGIGGERK